MPNRLKDRSWTQTDAQILSSAEALIHQRKYQLRGLTAGKIVMVEGDSAL